MFPALSFLTPLAKTNVLKIVGVLGIVLILGFGYYQYKNNIKLQAQNYNLQATVVETQVRLDTVRDQANNIARLNNNMVQRERQLNKALFDLSHKFNKNGRNFEKLARRKPGLIAPIINKATRATYDCFELITLDEECVK